MAAVAACPGPDCLRDIVPKVGQRLKVYREIKSTINTSYSMESLASGTIVNDSMMPCFDNTQLMTRAAIEVCNTRGSITVYATVSLPGSDHKGRFEHQFGQWLTYLEHSPVYVSLVSVAIILIIWGSTCRNKPQRLQTCSLPLRARR